MATQIINFEPIAAPDVQRPASLSSLPDWLRARLDNLKREHQPDETGKYREVPILPSCELLNDRQKEVVRTHAAELARALEMTPANDRDYGATTLTVVSKMLLTLAGRESGGLAGEARGEAYLAALEDVPCWAVQEAARKWYRGEYGPSHDYRWMPAPAILRELSQLEQWRVQGTKRQLGVLLEARPPRDFGPDHEASMRKKIAALGLSVISN